MFGSLERAAPRQQIEVREDHPSSRWVVCVDKPGNSRRLYLYKQDEKIDGQRVLGDDPRLAARLPRGMAVIEAGQVVAWEGERVRTLARVSV